MQLLRKHKNVLKKVMEDLETHLDTMDAKGKLLEEDDKELILFGVRACMFIHKFAKGARAFPTLPRM